MSIVQCHWLKKTCFGLMWCQAIVLCNWNWSWKRNSLSFPPPVSHKFHWGEFLWNSSPLFSPLFPDVGEINFTAWFHNLFHHWGNTIHQFSPDFPRIPPPQFLPKFTNFPWISPEFPPKFTNFPWISPEFPNDSYWFLMIPQFPVQFSLPKCSLQRLWALGLFYEYYI